ncbi:MAG: DUF1800 domain-containing protein [Acidobacteriota bacterium]
MTSRRSFLKSAGLAGLSALFIGCDGQERVSWIFGRSTPRRPAIGDWNGSPAQISAAHLLKRITYGPRPGDITRVSEIGITAFIEEQLAPDSISDEQAYWLTRRIETLQMKAPDIFELPAQRAITDLRRGMLLRALYSERQLQEVMVEFWSDHFNIFADKEECAWLKVIDDREVIRPHALGKFPQLLRASATSPAMLVYLDGRVNQRGKPNENYARELLELHTLGINGGYHQEDVMELSRALTGWQVKKHFWRGQVHFESNVHDNSIKTILGHQLAAGNADDLDKIIEIVSRHRSTAHFISNKLCRRFVSDTPSQELIAHVAEVFHNSEGDIKETLRALLYSEEFLQSLPKLKRPYTYTISALRALGAISDGGPALQEHLCAMGQLPFGWPTPDGYPDGEQHWQAQLLARWNFAIELANRRIDGTYIDLRESSNTLTTLAPALLQRELTQAETETIYQAFDDNNMLALLLCLPDFQYH